MAGGYGMKIALNSLWNFSSYGLTIILSILITPFIINRIGVDSLGLFALVTVLLAPLDLANLGFGDATIKYVAEYSELKDWDTVNQYLSTTYLMNIIVGVAGMFFIMLLGPYIGFEIMNVPDNQSENFKNCFLIVSFGWLIRQCTAVFMAIPPAFQSYKLMSVGNFLSSITSSVAVLIAVFIRPTLISYTLGTVIGSFVTLIIWYGINKIYFPYLNFQPRFFKKVWRNSFKYGGWQTIGNVGSIVTNQSDKYLIGVYLTPSHLGIYNVILQVQQKILSAVWKIAEVLFPTFSAITKKSNCEKFGLLIRSTWVVTLVGIIVFLPLFPLSSSILSLWIDSEFARSGDIVLKSLLLVGIFASMSVVQIFFLMGNGNIKEVTFIYYFTGVVTISLSFLLIPRFGLNGAGYGVLLAAIIRLIPIWLILKKVFKNDFSLSKYFFASILPILIGILCLIVVELINFVAIDSWFVVAAMYCGFVLLMLISIILVNFLFPDGRELNNNMLFFSKLIKSTISNRIN